MYGILICLALIAILIVSAVVRMREIESTSPKHTLDYGLPMIKRIKSEAVEGGLSLTILWQTGTRTGMNAGVLATVFIAATAPADEIPLPVLRRVARIVFDTVNEKSESLSFAELMALKHVIAQEVDKRLAEGLANLPGLTCRTSLEVSIFYPAYSRWD